MPKIGPMRTRTMSILLAVVFPGEVLGRWRVIFTEYWMNE